MEAQTQPSLAQLLAGLSSQNNGPAQTGASQLRPPLQAQQSMGGPPSFVPPGGQFRAGMSPLAKQLPAMRGVQPPFGSGGCGGGQPPFGGGQSSASAGDGGGGGGGGGLQFSLPGQLNAGQLPQFGLGGGPPFSIQPKAAQVAQSAPQQSWQQPCGNTMPMSRHAQVAQVAQPGQFGNPCSGGGSFLPPGQPSMQLPQAAMQEPHQPSSNLSFATSPSGGLQSASQSGQFGTPLDTSFFNLPGRGVNPNTAAQVPNQPNMLQAQPQQQVLSSTPGNFQPGSIPSNLGLPNVSDGSASPTLASNALAGAAATAEHGAAGRQEPALQASAQPPQVQVPKVGDHVEAQCLGWGNVFYPGVVREILPNGEYQVLWDGDEPSISNCPPQCVKVSGPDEEAQPAAVEPSSSAPVVEQPPQPAVLQSPSLSEQPVETAPADVAQAQPRQREPPATVVATPAPASVASPAAASAAAAPATSAPRHRNYRYDLGPGDEIGGPMANLRRRVETEVRDGCTVMVSLTIVRPEGVHSGSLLPVGQAGAGGMLNGFAQRPVGTPSN